MTFKLMQPMNVQVTRARPKQCRLTQAYYLGYGRNAWHSTWSNIYFPNSLSFDQEVLKNRAESQRVQGSVFRIETVPALILDYHLNTFLLAPINERAPDDYKRILQDSGSDGRSFWSQLPPSGRNWILCFVLKNESIPTGDFSPWTLSSHSHGSHYRLGWSLHDRQRQYEHFVAFSRSLSSILLKRRPDRE